MSPRARSLRLTLAVLASIAVATCDFKKTEAFFGLGLGDGPGQLDTDPPELFDPQPLCTVDVLNTTNFMVRARDAGSGVDFSTIGAIDGGPLPTSFTGDMITIDVAGLSDGSHTIMVTVDDLAGNTGSLSFGPKILDRLAPTFDFTSGPTSFDVTTDESNLSLGFGLNLMDANFRDGSFWVGMDADGTCDGSEPPEPTVDQGGHVVQNPFALSSGSNTVDFEFENPLQPGDADMTVGYCFNGSARDRAAAKDGTPNPNETAFTFDPRPLQVTYQAPPPPTGIKVNVVDDQGSGIGGVDVTVEQSGSPVGGGTTSGTGMFTITGLTPGVYDVAIQPPSGSGLSCPNPSRTVQVNQGQTAEETFRCDRPGMIMGSVSDPGGAGIPDVDVTTIDPQGGSMTTTTDTNGDFLFDPVPVGPWDVMVDRDQVVCEQYVIDVDVQPGGVAKANFTDCVPPSQLQFPTADQLGGPWTGDRTLSSSTGSCPPPVNGTFQASIGVTGQMLFVGGYHPDLNFQGNYDPATGNFTGTGQTTLGNGFTLEGDQDLMFTFDGNGAPVAVGVMNIDHIPPNSNSPVCTEMYNVDAVRATASSARFKRDVTPLLPGDGTVLGLRPVRYRYGAPHGDPSIVRIGLIAEEVHAVYPEAVVLDDEGRPLAIRYEVLTRRVLDELRVRSGEAWNRVVGRR